MSRAEERRTRTEIRKKLAQSRKLLKDLARSKRDALKQISRDCRTARKAVRERVKAWRQMQAQMLKTAHYGARAEARDACEAEKRRAIKEATNAADGVKRAIEIEQKHLLEVQRRSKPVNAKRRAAGALGDERRQEALNEIASNMPAEYLPVFNAYMHEPGMQRAIKRGQTPGARLSATEAVLEYIAEHPHLHYDIARKHESDAARDFDQHYAQLRKLSKQKRPKLEDVPF